MAMQQVKNITYLCVSSFKLDKAEQDAILVPKGAEVVSVNLEIIKPLSAPATEVSIGLEGKQDCFIARAQADVQGFHQSDVYLTSQKVQKIKVSVKGADAKLDTLATLRVQYFLPSEISIEV